MEYTVPDYWGADIVASVAALRGDERCPSIGDLCLDTDLIGGAIALGSAQLKAWTRVVGGLEPLFRGGDLAGRGCAFLLKLLEGGEVLGCLLLLQLGSAEIPGE